MNHIPFLSREEKEELFLVTSRKISLPEAVVEKDFWVCWVLNYLFHGSAWKEHLAFKGGTSLSKCFHLIQRFSEDIDLILDWRLVGCTADEPWEQRSKTRQDKYNKAVNERTEVFLKEQFMPEIEKDFRELLPDSFHLYIDPLDAQTVCFAYPRIFGEDAILPVIRLEIGTLAAWTPTIQTVIKPFAAEQFPEVFLQAGTELKTVTAERTFWEKVTILHKEAFRTNGSIPSRYSRHYYDLWCMMYSTVKDRAFSDLDLLKKVTEFKARFYPSGSAHYELAVPGSMRLMPPKNSRVELYADYRHMRNMIFGNIPEFDDILLSMETLERQINELYSR